MSTKRTGIVPGTQVRCIAASCPGLMDVEMPQVGTYIRATRKGKYDHFIALSVKPRPEHETGGWPFLDVEFEVLAQGAECLDKRPATARERENATSLNYFRETLGGRPVPTPEDVQYDFDPHTARKTMGG